LLAQCVASALGQCDFHVECIFNCYFGYLAQNRGDDGGEMQVTQLSWVISVDAFVSVTSS